MKRKYYGHLICLVLKSNHETWKCQILSRFVVDGDDDDDDEAQQQQKCERLNENETKGKKTI